MFMCQGETINNLKKPRKNLLKKPLRYVNFSTFDKFIFWCIVDPNTSLN